MNTIESLLESLAQQEWYSSSNIPGVSFLKTTHALPRMPLKYESRIIIMGRGEKTGYIHGKRLVYNANNYLILSLPMTFECEAKADVLALVIDIDLSILGEIIADTQCDLSQESQIEAAVHAIPLKKDLRESVIRLLRIAHSKEESHILGKNILKEVLFRILQDEHGGALKALYSSRWKFSRFAQLIHKINSHPEKPYTLQELARDMAMSEVSLHRYFKKITSESPIQYIKNIRLQKAKDLLRDQNSSIKEISRSIGYKSQSQFSREFRKYFWMSPKQAQKSWFGNIV